ncbi:MAG: hypothetical protein E7430_02145 [Ruminococcaceae bacterium]|nr:hypothetical protein [Oscillospiraceae bacterium]
MKRNGIRRAAAIILLTAAILLLCGFYIPAFAGRSNSGFLHGVGEYAGGHLLDYVYYEPEGRGSYPLVIWLHGLGHGKFPGDQLNGNEIENWSTREYQSRFDNAGGAYILCPRCPENNDVTWWSAGMEEALMALIEEFIEEHTNVDTDRIYIGGFSLGGYMTLEMCKAYPDYFAAAFPVCPAVQPWNSDLSQLSDMPVWLTTSTLDRTVPYRMVSDFWDNLMEVSNVSADCRISLLGQVRSPDGRKLSNNHYSWYAVTSDMFTTKKQTYFSMKTFDGNGNEIEFSFPDGMISWLSGHTK